ncbi:hypothetical protein SAMN05444678_102241 [Sphingomonas sp. YR710]|uniref:hypothetical protein n=1 Tax=Sphingomonas sp. YR710 TaxID=1882773 RepID=UPI0008832DC2|nr:hypothetical protein [Sphingomonas sp. YR710]SDC30166.1 hypothetical protein SAMN05444678_102241 [Sphingomonas sp. YR710]
MGGFRVAERLLTDRIARATGDDLIRVVQMDRYGTSRGVNNRGQLLLANWIMEYPADREILFDGRGFDVERLIAGELLPGNMTAAIIEMITANAVMIGHWQQRLTIDEPRAGRDVGIRAARAGDDAEMIATPAASSPTLLTIDRPVCRLGERTHGPLFEAHRTPGGAILLAGMGVALTLDEGMATVARDALTRALDARKAVQ